MMERPAEVDGIIVLRPSKDVCLLASMCYDRAYADAIRDGRPTMAQAEACARKDGLWEDERQAKFDELRRLIEDGVSRLNDSRLSHHERLEIARAIRHRRSEFSLLVAQLDHVRQETAESAGLEALVEAIIVRCSVDSRFRRPVFRSLADYRQFAPTSRKIILTEAVARALCGANDEFPEELVLRQLEPSCC